MKVFRLRSSGRSSPLRLNHFAKRWPLITCSCAKPARQSYDLLAGTGTLRGKTQLIIVPDDVLWELLFQALLTRDNRYLIEQSAISRRR